MTITAGNFKDNLNVPVRVCLNGYPKILPFGVAYVIFWKVRFGWMLNLDWFRSRTSQGNKTGYVGKVVKNKASYFIYHLLTRGCLALGINDNCLQDEHQESPSPNLFNAYAYRFGKLFTGSRPYEFMLVPDGPGPRVRAYRMKCGETWMILLGLAPETQIPDAEVEWPLFCSPLQVDAIFALLQDDQREMIRQYTDPARTDE